MYLTPSYQIIDFIDYIKNNKKVLNIMDEEELSLLVDEFLRVKECSLMPNMRTMLLLFQNHCLRNSYFNEDSMKNFAEEIVNNEFQINNLYYSFQLHPLLNDFLKLFYRTNYRGLKNKFYKLRQKIEYYIERNNYNKSEFIRLLIGQLQDDLIRAFEMYMYSIADPQEVWRFKDYCRGYEHSQYGYNEREAYYEKLSLSEKKKRLVNSIKNIDAYPKESRMDLIIGQVIDKQWDIVINFLEWIKQKEPNILIEGNIPMKEIKIFANEYSNEKSYSLNDSFLKKIEQVFCDRGKDTILEKILLKIKKPGITYDSYNRVKIHGIFLYPQSGNGNLESFIHNRWRDLNDLTGHNIDIYYSKEDAKKRTGFAILNNLRSLNHIDRSELPAIILWGDMISNAKAISMKTINDENKMRLMASIVDEIRYGKDIDEIVAMSKSLVNKILEEEKLSNARTHIYGDQIINNGEAGIIKGTNIGNINLK